MTNLDDLKWESFSDDLDYIAYSMNQSQNFSNCKEECLNMNATLLAIPKNAKSMFYFLKAAKPLRTCLKSHKIVFFLHFEKEDMPNVVHDVCISLTILSKLMNYSRQTSESQAI